MASKHHGYSRLEAGLLDTREEEKAPFITPAPDHSKSASAHCPLDAQRPSGKMSPLKRVGLIIAISLFVGLGLALARDPSVTAPCMRWVHGPHQVPSRIARTALNKRQDASLANATTPAISTEQSKTTANPVQSTPPAVVSSSSLPLTTVPVVLPTSTAAPSSPAPEATSTSTPKAPQQTSQPPQASTTSNAPQVPVITSSNAPATTPGEVETSSTPPSPDTSGTSTTRQEPVSESSSSSPSSSSSSSSSSPSVVQESSSSRSSKAESSSVVNSTRPSFYHAATTTASETTPVSSSSASSAPTTSDVAPTSSNKFEKTITTGRVATSIPVAHVMTTTLPNGGTLTITSTSWVAVVPTEKATSTSEPKLQNAAPKSRGGCNLILAVGVATIGMLLI